MAGGDQEKAPSVSVIMNCLNGAQYLREAIDSVYAQTYPDWEIVFWDNSSSDESAEIAKSYGQRVRYFRSEETYPLGKARNLALEQARGEYLAFLDCDDVWLPTKLEKQVALFERSPNLGLVYCDALNVVETVDHVESKASDLRPLYRGWVFEEILYFDIVWMSAAVLRKSVLERVGLFDITYNIVEELDLFLRISEQYEFDFVDEPLSIYRVHAGNTARDASQRLKEKQVLYSHWLSKRPDLEARRPELIRMIYFSLYSQMARYHLRKGQFVRFVVNAHKSLVSVRYRPGFIIGRLVRFLDRTVIRKRKLNF